MGIDLNLLRKVAKVYEAADSVDNMPVKHTRESHKKCAPGEFGLNKEGNEYMSPGRRAKQHGQEHELSVYDNSDYRNHTRGRQPAPGFKYLERAYLDPAIRNRDEHNRRLGGTYPNDEVFPGSYAVDRAVRGDQPDQAYDFQRAIRDADFEALQHSDIAKAPLPGLLGAAIKGPSQYAAAQRYAGAQGNAAASRQQYNEYMQGAGRGKHPFIQQQIPESAVPAPMGKRFPFSGAVDKIEKAVGRGIAPYEQKLQGPADLQKLYNQLPKLPRRPFDDAAAPAAPAVKKSSALQFGAAVKQALHPALGMAGLGGAGGLIAGGLSGLIAPGEYEDEDGNVKRRGRLSTALQRALGMGAVGAGLGGAYGMYDREGSGKAVDFARQLYQSLMGGGGKAKQPAKLYNEDSPAVRAALESEKRYGPMGAPIQVGGPKEKPTATTGSALPDTKLPGPSASKKPSLGPVAELMGNDRGQSTYSPTPEKYVQQRSADAKHKNTLTFPYGKETDPLTGEPAVPFNMQR